jgi:cell division protein FtsL
MLPILLLVLGLSLIALAVTASRHARRQREIESRLAAEQALRDAEFQRLVDAYGSEAASRILAHEV